MDLGTIKKVSKAEQKFKIKIPLCINKKGREKFPKNPKKNVRLFFPSTHPYLSTDELTFTSRSR